MSFLRAFAASFALMLTGLVATAQPGAASPAPRAAPVPHVSPTPGYWLAGFDGGVFSFNAPFEGSAAPQPGSPGLCPYASGSGTINVSAASLAGSSGVISRINCVGIAAAGTNAGYWIANFSSLPSGFGAAADPGQMGCSGLNGADVGWAGIAPTRTGDGFFLVSTNGAVLGCGDAVPLGGVTNLTMNGVIVGMATTPDGKGYWLVGSDGGVFSFGDAAFYGSTGNLALNRPVVGMVGTPDGKGYWLVAADGGVFGFGDATFYGSMGGRSMNSEVTGMAANPDGPGYWLVGGDGGVFAFGGAPFEGSLGGASSHTSIVGIAATPN